MHLMILIVSQSTGEYSTERVIDWLNYYKTKFIRINGDEVYDKKGLIVNNITSNTQEWRLNLGDLSGFNKIEFSIGWFRRWSNKEEILKEVDHICESKQNLISVYQYWNIGSFIVQQLFFSSIKVKEWLTNPYMNSISKPKQLLYASKCGLQIPNTCITSSRDELFTFAKKLNKNLIIKDLSAPLTLVTPDFKYTASTYTKKISTKEINLMSSTFFPTLFQEELIKEYELRVFFIDDECYAMAIFSQNDTKTAVDFRNYNYDVPNRNVPYNLPSKLKKALIKFMNNIGLNCGSIDIVKTKKAYVFLEVNPVGQFGMTSFPCNYNLEKKVAEYLIKKENEK